jgi:hypothetical protein
MATHAVKNFIRNRDFFKIASAIETGAEHGMWTLPRYRAWLESRKNWYVPGQSPEPGEPETQEAPAPPPSLLSLPSRIARPEATQPAKNPLPAPGHKGRIEIEPAEEFGKILKPPQQKP